MASNSGQGGIQQLLAAEQEAQQIVNAAKNGIVAVLHFCISACCLHNVI
jgi:V-type H+-transporting ATPase subunit G